MILESFKLMLSWAGPFLIVLSVLVFIHELGHYLVARYNKVKIEVFSIGFGPEVFGWTDPHETRWKISLIPLGGYVRMFGDANEASVPNFDHAKKLSAKERKQTLNGKTVWQRMAVSIAGPMANILLTFILLSLVFFFSGKASEEPIIGKISTGSVAERAGLQTEDRIIRLDDFSPTTFKEVQAYINARPDTTVIMELERMGERIIYEVIPEAMNITAKKKIGVLGVGSLSIKQTLWSAPIEAAKTVWTMSRDLLNLLGSLFSGDNAGKLGSVLSIAKMSKDSLEGGLVSLMFFMAVLSLNLGVINLLPVPMLDGGHLFFYMIEAIRGKPVGERAQEISFKIGFAILMGVMLFTLWNDIARFGVIEYLVGLFK